MSEKVIDLSVAFAMNKTAARVLKRATIIGEVADEITTVICTMSHEEQRFLTAIIGWRIEGGSVLPASDLLSKLPALHGLEFGSIQATAQKLVDADVLEVVPLGEDAKGNVTSVGFVWPALERLIHLGEESKGGPKPRFVDSNGQPLR